MQREQLAWAIIGWLNLIPILIVVAVISGVELTAWRILGGMLVVTGVVALLLWSMTRVKG